MPCCAQSLSRVQLFATLRTVGHQPPLSVGCSRQEYWSGLPCPPPGDLPDPGIERVARASPTPQPDSLLLSRRGSPKYALLRSNNYIPLVEQSWGRVFCKGVTGFCLQIRRVALQALWQVDHLDASGNKRKGRERKGCLHVSGLNWRNGRCDGGEGT